MASQRSNSDLCEVDGSPSDGGLLDALSDRVLMERFARSGDESAFEALVGRHGPMVLRVCRQMLGDAHDAQDAFQATFLVLACRAGSMRRYDSAASWLYGVALRVARSSRKMTARRRIHEYRCAESKPVESIGEADPSESFDDLHEEIGSLPEKLRLPVVLCYLEGMTAEATAERLGCPRGTVLSRLAAAKERLRRRLTRRGIALPAGLLTAGISAVPVEASIPATLAQSVVHSASQIASGGTVTSAATAEIASLASHVLKPMYLAKTFAIGVTASLVLGGVATTTALVIGLARVESAAGQEDQKTRLEAVCQQWSASAEKLSGSLKIRMTRRDFLEQVPTKKGGTPLTGRPSMQDRLRVERPLFRKRATPSISRSIILYEFSDDRFRARRFRRDADVPTSPDYVEVWDGETWKVRDSDFGVIGRNPQDGFWLASYGLPYPTLFRSLDVGFTYMTLIQQRICTIAEEGRLIRIHAPERDGVALNLTYFTFWLDPARGMLPVKLERGTAGKPPDIRVDITLEEVKPGLWAPMVIRTKNFDLNEGTPTYGQVFAEIDFIVQKESSRFGGTFDLSTFTLEFPEGLRIIDRMNEPSFRRITQ